MITFFKKLRQNYLMDNHKTKYLKYAVGEIVLVVVGILVALYINNWNENSKKEGSRQSLLLQMKEENTLNLKSLRPDESYRDTLDTTLYNFYQFLKEDDIQKEELQLKNYLETTLRTTIYNFSENYLEQYINEVRDKGSDFTEELLNLRSYQENLNIISQKAADYKFDNIFSKLSKEVDFENLEFKSYDYIKSLEFRNSIVLLENLETALYDAFDGTIRQQQKVDSLIQVQLK